MSVGERTTRVSRRDPDPPVPPAGAGGDGGSSGAPGPSALLALLGVALMLVGGGLAFVASGYGRGANARAAGGNTPVNAGARAAADISAHNSPSLVANPKNAANLVIVNKIDSPRFSCALHTSFDGGVHWNQTPIPLPAGEEPKCYAPDVVFAADGAMYMSFVTLKGRANAPHAVWLIRSPDGGQTLSDPVRIRGPLKFQVRMAADPTAAKRLYMTWVDTREVSLFRFAQAGNPIRAARSDDGGRSWSQPVTINAPSHPRALAPSPAVGPKGELYVEFLDLGKDRLDYEGGHGGRGGPPYAGTWKLVMAKSTDRGVTWKESVIEDKLAPAQRFIAFTPPFPSLAVDRRSGTIYSAFHDRRSGNADVYVWTLKPGSPRWSPPVRVNDTPRSDRSSQLLPALSVAPDGRLDVLYYDRRVDPADRMTEVSLQSSFDGGRSFLPRLRLSDRPFDSRIGYGSERGIPDLGSRLGLISTSERALGVWTDTRGGTLASGKQDLARGLAAFAPPSDLSSTSKTLLRVVAILLVLLGAGLVAYVVARRQGWMPPNPQRRLLSPTGGKRQRR